MRRRLGIALAATIGALTLTGCGGYGALPMDGDRECFQITRYEDTHGGLSRTTEAVGVYCKEEIR